MSGAPVSRESVSVIICTCVEHEPFDNVFACLCLIMLVCTSVCYTFPFAYSVCVFCAFICDLTESARHCVCVIMLCVCFPVHLIVRSWMVAWSLVVKAVVCLVHLSCCTVCLSRQLSQLDSSRLPSNKQCSFRVTNSILYTVKDHYFI